MAIGMCVNYIVVFCYTFCFCPSMYFKKCFLLLSSLYEQIFKPSKLPGNADFHLFRAGVEPKWEDPECANGGKWSIPSNRKTTLDLIWLETVYIQQESL